MEEFLYNDRFVMEYSVQQSSMSSDPDSDDESSSEIHDIPLFNLDIGTLQRVKDNAELQDSDVEEEDYDLCEKAEESDMSGDPDEGTDQVLPNMESERYTPCVIVDNDNDEQVVQRCNKINAGGANRPLKQLKSTWEVDRGTVEQFDGKLHELGVCYRHFLFDQNQLHEEKIQQLKTDQSALHRTRCLLCNKYKIFFTRGQNCPVHSWTVCGRNIRVPCLCLKSCKALRTCFSICTESTDNIRPLYICTRCFEDNGGHLHKRLGRGPKKYSCYEQHNDSTTILETFGHWLLSVAKSNNESQKQQLIWSLLPMIESLKPHLPTKVVSQQSPPLESTSTPLMVQIALRLAKVNVSREAKVAMLRQDDCTNFGTIMGESLWQSRTSLKEVLPTLENPESLVHYAAALPRTLWSFVYSFVSVIQQKKHAVAERKRRSRGSPSVSLDPTPINRITIFMVSMLLGIAFRGWKIWLPHVLGSLCRRPRLISKLHAILRSAHVISYVWDHEVRTEKKRMEHADPAAKLEIGGNIYNLAVIDNIDLQEKTFAYGNIYDVARRTSHATLRMVFQFRLPSDLQAPHSLFFAEQPDLIVGLSAVTKSLNEKYDEIFKKLLLEKAHDFDVTDIHLKVTEKVHLGCRFAAPKVVILKPGPAPNSNENVYRSCDMFLDDLRNTGVNTIDIACDEAIFRRFKKYENSNLNVNHVLGQWHTSKDMCKALIKAFSGYGIFNMAAQLGVKKYMEHLEKGTDYRATCTVLELIWAAVGIAIHRYLLTTGKSIEEITGSSNNILKVWTNYYRWAGYWKAHKVGIRRGDFDLQIACLAAFAPLFPVTGCFRYAESVATFLGNLHQDPEFQKRLFKVPSVNLTQDGHYLAYDEALETYGVQFVKQMMTGRLGDEKNLQRQIQGSQGEIERLSALDEFINDETVSVTHHAIKNRKKQLWTLCDQIYEAFQNPDDSPLFENTTQNTPEGYYKMETCYEEGRTRMQNLLAKQKIGRGAKVLVTDTVSAAKQRERAQKQKGKQRALTQAHDGEHGHAVDLSEEQPMEWSEEQQVLEITEGHHAGSSTAQTQSTPARLPISSDSTARPTKKVRKDFSAEEIQTLGELTQYKGKLPQEVSNSVAEKLKSYGWNAKKVWDYWYNISGERQTRKLRKGETEMK